METKNDKKPKKAGRPPVDKKLDLTIDNDYVIIKIPRKDLTKKLLQVFL